MANKKNEKQNNSDYAVTKKVLEIYRKIYWTLTVDKIQYESNILEKHETDLLDYYSKLSEIKQFNVSLEANVRRSVLSAKLLELVKDAVNRIKKHPKAGNIYHYILYYSYIVEEELPIESLLEQLKKQYIYLSISTYYRYRTEAIRELTPILFGISSTDITQVLEKWLKEQKEYQKKRQKVSLEKQTKKSVGGYTCDTLPQD